MWLRGVHDPTVKTSNKFIICVAPVLLWRARHVLVSERRSEKFRCEDGDVGSPCQHITEAHACSQ